MIFELKYAIILRYSNRHFHSRHFLALFFTPEGCRTHCLQELGESICLKKSFQGKIFRKKKQKKDFKKKGKVSVGEVSQNRIKLWLSTKSLRKYLETARSSLKIVIIVEKCRSRFLQIFGFLEFELFEIKTVFSYKFSFLQSTLFLKTSQKGGKFLLSLYSQKVAIAMLDNYF